MKKTVRLQVKNFMVNMLLPIVTGSIFLMLYLGFCYRMPMNQIFAPNTTWNDDALYYKQLSSVVECGYPRGYFGYNESHAAIGSFGTWGPVLFYIYAVPASIIGITPNMMLICNIIFILAGWAVFVNCTEISWKQQVLIALMISFMQLPVRYVMSGMSEALGYAIIMMLIGISYAEWQHRRLYREICLISLAVIYTLIRPYGIVFLIFPIMIFMRRKNYKAMAFSCLAGAGAFALSVFFMRRLSAPYLYSSISNEGLQLIFSGHIVKGCIVYLHLLVQEMRQAVLYIFEDCQKGEGLAGIVYADTILLVFILVVCMAIGNRKNRKNYLKTEILLTTLFIFLTISSFYSVYQGARHMLILGIGLVDVLVIENREAAVWAAIGMFFIYLGIKWEEPRYPLRYEEVTAQALRQYADMFAGLLPVHKDGRISWDNTIAYDMSMDVRWMYCITDGMGIQYDEADYLENPENEIKARYVMTCQDSKACERLMAEEYEIIMETDDFLVFERD